MLIPAPDRGILIVDDDPDIRKILKHFLQKIGFSADDAPDGSAGLECLKQKEYGIVFLDIEMPKIDGMQFLETVAKQHPRIHVVMVTARRDTETILKTMAKGAIDFLPKPPRYEEFQSLFENRNWLPKDESGT